jgi:preprotein translocase subunit SecE
MNKRFDEELEKIAYIKRKEWLGVFGLILLMAVIMVLIIWGFSELYTKYI